MPDSKLSPAARWSALCVGAALVAVATVAWVNYRIDLYGLFGGAQNAPRVIYTNDRAGKYLLSIRYIPQRFNAILLGTSMTYSWDTSKIRAFRVYNGSLGGGNISEGKLLADNALDARTLRAILFCINPYFTETHVVKGGGMDQRQFLGAFGSLQLLRDYSVALAVSRGLSRPRWNEYGIYDPTVEGADRYLPKRGWWLAGGAFTAPERVTIDPVAFSDFAALVKRARSQGVMVIPVTPPIHYERWRIAKPAFDAYYSQMATLFQKDDLSFDFNSLEFESFRKRRDTFSDGYHISKAAADFIMKTVDESLWRCCGPRLSARKGSAKEAR